MSRSDGTIEDQVLRAARSYLYGHADAWGVPARQRSAGGEGRRGASWRRVVGVLGERVGTAGRPEPLAEPGPCS